MNNWVLFLIVIMAVGGVLIAAEQTHTLVKIHKAF